MAQSVRQSRRSNRRPVLRTKRNIDMTRRAQTFLSQTVDCHLCKTTGKIPKGLGSFITGDTIPCTNCGGTGHLWVTKDWVKWTIALTVGAILLVLLISLMSAGVVKPFGSGAMQVPTTAYVDSLILAATTPLHAQVTARIDHVLVHPDGFPPPDAITQSIEEVL